MLANGMRANRGGLRTRHLLHIAVYRFQGGLSRLVIAVISRQAISCLARPLGRLEVGSHFVTTFQSVRLDVTLVDIGHV